MQATGKNGETVESYAVTIEETLERTVRAETFDAEYEDDVLELDGYTEQIRTPCFDGCDPSADYRRDHLTATELIRELGETLPEVLAYLKRTVVPLGEDYRSTRLLRLRLAYLAQECGGWEQVGCETSHDRQNL